MRVTKWPHVRAGAALMNFDHARRRKIEKIGVTTLEYHRRVRSLKPVARCPVYFARKRWRRVGKTRLQLSKNCLLADQ